MTDLIITLAVAFVALCVWLTVRVVTLNSPKSERKPRWSHRTIGMSERKPSYWRTFWVTAAVVGTVNLALLLCYLLSPPYYGRKPIWMIAGFFLNIPGVLLGALIFRGWIPQSDADVTKIIILCQVISTFFWASVAAGVRWTVNRFRNRSVNLPAPNPDAGAEADRSPAL